MGELGGGILFEPDEAMKRSLMVRFKIKTKLSTAM